MASFLLFTSTLLLFFFSSRRRHTRLQGDWSSDVCSSDLLADGLHLLEDGDGLRGVAFAQQRLREVHQDGHRLVLLARLQIGRASCRERVEDAVEGGAWQKKNAAE